ncbi:MAG: Saccharopine dehydrogenase [Alectoria sarmentosa]|nr:MAG: Saccharopine dehydrogenase [Alectoria sarmentosa]
MCPSCTGDVVNGNNGHVPPTTNGHANGTNGFGPHTPHNPRRQPFASLGDFLSNVSNFKIIESTLREGEQFANAFFDTETKIKIARALDAFGVEYIELTSPASSEQSRKDCEIICNLGLKAKILTHVRCHMDDARIAVETGVDGLDIVIGTSPQLMQHSHGKSMDYIKETALEVIQFVKSKGLECRFSSEDSFRSDLVDLLNIYSIVAKAGVDSTGCAIANAYCALEAGATHVDCSVLGIGERNGITPLGGFVARMLVADRDYVRSKYDLTKLKAIEDMVAAAVEINVPFNNYITVHFTSRLTGWNAIKSRVNQLGLEMTDSQIKSCTVRIKAMADVRHLAIEDTDAIINAFYENLYSEQSGEKPLLDDMTAEEKMQFAQKEAELSQEPESQHLDHIVDQQTNALAKHELNGHEGVDVLNGDTAATT